MAWTFRRGAGTQTGGLAAPTVSFASTVNSGNIVVGFFFWTASANTDTIGTIKDDKNNVYPHIQFQGENPTQVYLGKTFWSGSTALTNTPTTITIPESSSSANQWACIGEFTPPAGTLATDGSTAQYQNVTNPTAGSITTTHNGDLVCAWGAISADGTSEGTGFTQINVTGTGNNIRGEFQSQTSAGAIGGAFSGTISDGIFMMFAISAVVSGSKLHRNANVDGQSASGPFFADPLAGRSRVGWQPSLILPKRKLILPERYAA